MMLHNSHQAFFRWPNTPVSRGTEVVFRFLCNAADEVVLRTWDGMEHLYSMSFDGNRVWEVRAAAPQTPMLW